MNGEPHEDLDAAAAIAWSRIWSPVVPRQASMAAWQALDLPRDETLRDVIFCSTFHAGFPSPKVPLFLHEALNQPGDHVRMDFLRAMSHLRVKAGAKMLPPDHLAVACEIVACALSADEPVIVAEIRDRYLLPWCTAAEARLAEDDKRLSEIVQGFRSYAAALLGGAPERAKHAREHAPVSA